MSSFVKIV